MLRYNHRVIERELLDRVKHSCAPDIVGSVWALTTPQTNSFLTVENARLLILADFFGWAGAFPGKMIHWLWPGCAEQPQGSTALGLPLVQGLPRAEGRCDLIVMPRDFFHLLPEQLTSAERLVCGRFCSTASLGELLADFGVDALRVYFLFLGPPQRDYQFCWNRLAAAYRFVERVWNLVQNPSADLNDTDSLRLVQTKVEQRLEKKKPHTALAAIMEYLKGKDFLTTQEISALAPSLQRYMPFLVTRMLNSSGADDPKLR